MRARTAGALLAAGLFLLWNAIFDHVLAVFGDLLVVLAPALAPYGLEIRLEDWMAPARALALWSATVVSLAALVAALAAAALWQARR